MDAVGRDSTDDELYAHFVTAISRPDEPARDAGDGVIEVLVRFEEGAEPERVELLLSREQLREHAWAEHDVFDDTDPDVVPPSDDPVRAGMAALTLDAEETLATLRPGERYVLHHRGGFRASVRRELPPVRARREEPEPVPGGAWMTFDSGETASTRVDATFAGFLTAQEELLRLLASMEPELVPGRYVFTTGPAVPVGVQPVATVREDEGVTAVVAQEDADRLGLSYDFVAARVTLRVRSELDAVGLTAAVAEELTAHGISCNVVAGYFHDHLFVPVERGAETVELLRALSEREG